jgi:hypothetical protein
MDDTRDSKVTINRSSIGYPTINPSVLSVLLILALLKAKEKGELVTVLKHQP